MKQKLCNFLCRHLYLEADGCDFHKRAFNKSKKLRTKRSFSINLLLMKNSLTQADNILFNAIIMNLFYAIC